MYVCPGHVPVQCFWICTAFSRSVLPQGRVIIFVELYCLLVQVYCKGTAVLPVCMRAAVQPNCLLVLVLPVQHSSSTVAATVAASFAPPLICCVCRAGAAPAACVHMRLLRLDTKLLQACIMRACSRGACCMCACCYGSLCMPSCSMHAGSMCVRCTCFTHLQKVAAGCLIWP